MTESGFVPVAPQAGRLRPLGSDEVRITGGFWAERQRVNAHNTLPHINYWLEREGWLANFDLAAQGTLPAGRRGREFADSEIYKFLEALAWEIGRTDDEQLETLFRSIVTRVAAAQEPDGYLNTNVGRPGQAERWSGLEFGHELYCLGHLFQAAVARARTRPDGDDGLLVIATRAADLVCDAFGSNGIQSICGHAVVETGLAELGRVVGEPRYLEQAKLFIDRHGDGALHYPGNRQYFQDDLPIRTATVLRGHAVRANYLAAGAVDVAVDTDDQELLSAVTTQWRNTVARRTYITGGQGSHHQDEAFGEDWVLPPDRAYSETCAGIGSVMFSWRLALALGDAGFSDLVERTLFNVVATSPSEDGKAFYYANTLHQRTPGTPPPDDGVSPRAESSLRAPWFDVACCPTNVARTMASLDAYLATTDGEGVQIHQYAASTIRTHLPDGRAVAFDIDTDYPRSGTIRITTPIAIEEPITLSLRIPSWAEGAELRDLATSTAVQPGWATVRRTFASGDYVELNLPLDPRIVHPDDRIDAVRGCVAIERGPEVLCLESVDDITDLRLDTSTPIAVHDGVPVVRVLVAQKADDAGWPYGAQHEPQSTTAIDVPLVPYHSWAERGPSTMRIWLPTQ